MLDSVLFDEMISSQVAAGLCRALICDFISLREKRQTSPLAQNRVSTRPSDLVSPAPSPAAVAREAFALPNGGLGIHAAANAGQDRPALFRTLDERAAGFHRAGGRARIPGAQALGRPRLLL